MPFLTGTTSGSFLQRKKSSPPPPPKKSGGGGGGSSSGGGGGGGGYSPPPQQSYSPPPQQSFSPSTTSSGQYRGGGRPAAPPSNRNQGPVGRVAPPKQNIPSVKKFLGGDADFQDARANLIKNFQSLKLENRQNRGNLKEDYQTTLQRLMQEQGNSLDSMESDFAARGLLGSGVYQEALNDFNMDFSDQRNDAETSFRRNLEQLFTDLSGAKSLKNQNMQAARLAAIRRRAQKFGIRD